MASLSQQNWDEEAAAGPSAGLDPSQSIETDSDTSGELLFGVGPRKQSRNAANEALLLMVQNNEHHQQAEDAFCKETIQVQHKQLGLQHEFVNLGINVLNTMQLDIQSLRNSVDSLISVIRSGTQTTSAGTLASLGMSMILEEPQTPCAQCGMSISSLTNTTPTMRVCHSQRSQSQSQTNQFC